MRPSAALLILVAATGCSPVLFRELRPDYDQADKTHTIRLAVVTAPLPDNLQPVGDMWSDIAKEYANLHRSFIVKSVQAAAHQAPNTCGEGIDGVLHFTPQLVRVDAKVTVTAIATLSRCSDGVLIWSAAGRGTWPSVDKGLTDVTEHYTRQFGDAVTPYVAPSFRLMKELLAILPFPSIEGNEAAIEEKIESS